MDDLPPASLIMRDCHWCGEDHPDQQSINWAFRGTLYFCSDRCHQEWLGSARRPRTSARRAAGHAKLDPTGDPLGWLEPGRYTEMVGRLTAFSRA